MDDPAVMVGWLIGLAISVAIPVVLIVVGSRRRRATDGRNGRALTVIGWVLLALVVLGLLGQAAQQASASS